MSATLPIDLDPDALHAELAAQLAAGTLGIDPADLQAFDLDPSTLGADFQLSVTGSHAKVTLMAPEEGGHYTLHGSANLRSSASIEQFALENDADLYAFHLAWIQALESQYHTIDNRRGAAPKRHQWQAVQQAAAPSKSPTTPDHAPRTNSAPPPPSAAPKHADARSAPSEIDRPS